MGNNITFLAGYYEPDISADTHLNSSLCNGLSRAGYKVTVVAPYPSRGISDDIISKYSNIREETNEYGVNIKRVCRGKFRKNIFLRGIYFIRKTILLYDAAKKVDTDAYVIMSTPPFLGLISSFLPKKAVKIYRLQDIFPDSLINSGIINEGGLIFKFLKYLEKRIYAGNDLIITVSKDMKDQLIARGVNSEKVKVIYNWIDENRCTPIEKKDNSLFEEFDIDKDKFNVVYAGNIGLLQNVETIIKAAEYLRLRDDIRFIIIGDGVLKEKIKEHIAQSKLNNIHMFPMQPLEKVSFVYSLGDVGLVSLKPGVSKSAMPSKTWSIMSAGRPVICEIDSYSELNEIVKNNKCGICIEPGDYVGMANAIVELSKLESLNEMGKNGRKYVCEYISEKTGIINFTKCVETLK